MAVASHALAEAPQTVAVLTALPSLRARFPLLPWQIRRAVLNKLQPPLPNSSTREILFMLLLLLLSRIPFILHLPHLVRLLLVLLLVLLLRPLVRLEILFVRNHLRLSRLVGL